MFIAVSSFKSLDIWENVFLTIYNYFGKQEMVLLVEIVKFTRKSEGKWNWFEAGNLIPKYEKEKERTLKKQEGILGGAQSWEEVGTEIWRGAGMRGEADRWF